MSGYSYRNFQNDTELLYTHLINLRKAESPDQLLQRLRYLIIEGTDYPNPDISIALNRIVLSKWAEPEFHLILNRCCYILMNYWWSQAELEAAAVDLVQLFQTLPATSANFQANQRLRDLVKQFTQSEQYAELQNRVRIVDRAPKSARHDRSQPIRELIPRYPYLYPYCLLNWDTSDLGQQVVRRLQVAKERQFEQDLLRYTTHWLRRSHNPQRTATPADPKNPTLLSDQHLETAIRQFAGKDEGGKTYRDLAQRVVSSSQQAPSYRVVKRQIYDYLTATVRPEYGKHHFNQWLSDRLEATLPQSDSLRPNGFLLVQTCAQIIDCLVAHPLQSSNHLVFVDLTSNLGATFTTGLLLKIILLCRGVKSNLEAIKAHLSRRLSLVLKHYETKVRGEIEWLVECLENLMVAFSIHFGETDFSCINLL